MAAPPTFSVVIPTYNWSSALDLALESVRGQSLSDFEVLVVGDGCTDDSEAVVRAFQDERFRWSNLAQNHGSQWAANNHALEHARGRYIAYLGHDDLWWPTHLETAAATFERSDADMVVAAALFYGPPGSGVRGVSGFFPHDRYGPGLFVPPSSIAHRRELVERIGPWLPMERARFSVDNDFVIRTHEAGARIVPTGEITTFKFSAGWRRDSYLRRDVTEQRRHLDLMQRDGEAFRRRELTGALQAAALDLFTKIEVPLDASPDAMKSAVVRWAFKGSRRQAPAGRTVEGRVRLMPEGGEFGFEWHGWESSAHGTFRWSGPSTSSTVVLPARLDRPLEVTIQIVDEITDLTLQTARLTANGTEMATRIEPGPEGERLWVGRIDNALVAADDREQLQLTVTVERTHRPYDLRISEDRRWLGLAVGWIELSPI